jgi:hypothetical protein
MIVVHCCFFYLNILFTSIFIVCFYVILIWHYLFKQVQKQLLLVAPTTTFYDRAGRRNVHWVDRRNCEDAQTASGDIVIYSFIHLFIYLFVLLLYLLCHLTLWPFGWKEYTI